MISKNYGRENPNGFDRYAAVPSGVDNYPEP